MLSKERLQAYRNMTPSQRLELTLQALQGSAARLLHGPPDIVQRRIALIRRENDARNQNILARLAAAERSDEKP